jgi:peptidoglycan-associated lipoprotein
LHSHRNAQKYHYYQKMTKFNLVASFMLLLAMYSCAPKYVKYLNKGQANFKQEEFQFSIENYKQAIAKGAPVAVPNYMIAESYRKSNRIQEAEVYYQKAIEAGIKEEDAYFYYARALKSTGNYESATAQYKEYLKIGNNFDLLNKTKKELENIPLLSEISLKPSYYTIKNLEALNTPSAEFSPILFNDNMYFTSSRGAEKMYSATGTGFTDLYEYIFDGTEKNSGTAKRLSKSLNSENAHEASATFSKDGKTIYFSRGNTGTKKGPIDVNIFYSKFENDEWTTPEILDISDLKAWDSSPALSADGKVLYFSSNREGGMGGTDLYKATLDANGKWSNVTNLGAPINTPGNEMFPFEDKEGTFYFSSDGHPSLGGLDIFKVVKENNKSKVENLGKPMNSSHDDFGIFLRDSLTGYFASNRPEGKGDDDLYEFVDISRIRHAFYAIDGSVFGQDKVSKHILADAHIKVINDKSDTIANIRSNQEGKFEFPVETEKQYKLIVSKLENPAYMTEKYDLSTIGQTVPFDKLKPGDNNFKIKFEATLLIKEESITFVVEDIYYDYNKWDIREDAALELDKIVEFLKNNTDISIELSSHTDERGAAVYNRELSQKRAQSAVDYMITKGIAKNRVSAKGYGKDKPLIKNADSEEDHQKNRRTEVKITGIDGLKMKIKYKGQAN